MVQGNKYVIILPPSASLGAPMGGKWWGNFFPCFHPAFRTYHGKIAERREIQGEKNKCSSSSILLTLFFISRIFLGDGDFGEMSTLVNINFSRFDDTEEMDESFMRKIILYMPIDRFFFVLSFLLFTTLVNQCQASGNSSIRRYTLRILLWNALVR